MRVVRLGVLVPSSNTASEPLTYAIVSSIQSKDVAISVHFSRFRVTTIDITSEANAQFEMLPILIAARLLADAKVDVIGWSGTSAGWLGFEHDQKLCAAIEADTGIKATTSVLSLNAILRSLGVISFGLVTPYRKELNDLIRENYAAIGVDINATWDRHLGLTDNNEIAQVDNATLDAMVMDVALNGANVLSTFCTNLQAAQRVEYWEKSSSVIVLDTVASVVWGMLKIVGVDTRLVKGWGYMFEVDG
jgi:maleate isomerase